MNRFRFVLFCCCLVIVPLCVFGIQAAGKFWHPTQVNGSRNSTIGREMKYLGNRKIFRRGNFTSVLHYFPDRRLRISFVPVEWKHGTVMHKSSTNDVENKNICLLSGSCTARDISISQSTYSSKGIPQYLVQIVNTCISGCPPSNIHLRCGWFASARMVNPTIFKRIAYDDCLVNGGRPLRRSQIISFTYSNSFMYPLAFKTAKFC